jgi:two-component system chemotaxis sensor kinase CheA
MHPIGGVWGKLPRLVRDVALACGKKVRLELDGGETELDRSVLEAVKDPLTHLVRNAVDHGIEAPSARSARGKPAEGRVVLRAYHEGGKVHVEVEDDGAGIDLRRVEEKAARLGLVAPEQVGRLSEADLVSLIFRPGFSTAETVTALSGRGVGMDVVKTNVERIAGSVDVHTRAGLGTTIKITIPLTLAIIPALVVTSRGARYAIPQASVHEVVRLAPGEAKRGIESVLGAPVYLLRGKLLTLVDLDVLLSGAANGSPPAAGSHERANVVVVQADDRRFGLIVEGVHDTEEIVVKPLGRHLKSVSVFAGATIMGDGKVALILDVLGIAQRAKVVGEAREPKVPPRPAEPQARGEERQTLLVVEVGGERAAIPLATVARLEEVPRSALERSGAREVLQYRNEIMPLVRLSRLLDAADAPAADRATLPIVVHASARGSVGLAVDRIVDIVDEALSLRREADRPGVVCTAVIQQRVTEVLDLPSLVRAAGDGLASGPRVRP